MQSLDDLEYARKLQEFYDKEFKEFEKTKIENEKKSIELAQKMSTNQQNTIEFGGSSLKESNKSRSKSLREASNSREVTEHKYQQPTQDMYLKSALKGFSNTTTFLEFCQDNESVQYDKATLNINFLTKEYFLELPKRRCQLLDSVSLLQSSKTTYSESMHLYSITKSELVREITLRSSKFCPVEIRYVAASMRSVNLEECNSFNNLAAKVFIYKHNGELRNYLMNPQRPKHISNKTKRTPHAQEKLYIPILDLHGLFVVEAKKRILPFFSLCASKRLRKCGLCVGKGKSTIKGYHTKSKLSIAAVNILKVLSKERQFSKRMVLSYSEEMDGLITIKLNLDCSCFLTN